MDAEIQETKIHTNIQHIVQVIVVLYLGAYAYGHVNIQHIVQVIIFIVLYLGAYAYHHVFVKLIRQTNLIVFFLFTCIPTD